MDERTGAAEGTIASGPAISEETQPVYAVVTLNYRVSDKAVQELYTDVGSTYFEKVVAPRVFQVFKNETVKFKSVSVAPNREQIRRAVQNELDRQLDELLDRRRRLPDQRPRLPAGVHRGDRAQAGRDAGRARGAAEGRAVEGRGAAGDRARARPGAGAAAPGELADRPQPPVRGAPDPQGGAAADRLPARRPGQPARPVDVPQVGDDDALIEICGALSAAPDRNLALELVRVTEAAALAASGWVGRGEKEKADAAAVDAMRLVLDTVEHERRRRDRRGGEGRGADALQRRGGRRRHRPRGRRRRRPARGHAADGARPAERDRRDRRRRARDDVRSRARPSTWTRSRSGPRRRTRSTSTRRPTENVRAVAKAKGLDVTEVTVVVLERDRHDAADRRAAPVRRARQPDPRRRRRARRSRRRRRSSASTC